MLGHFLPSIIMSNPTSLGFQSSTDNFFNPSSPGLTLQINNIFDESENDWNWGNTENYTPDLIIKQIIMKLY